MHNLQTVERSHRLTICNLKEKSCLGRMSTKMWGAHARLLKNTNQTKNIKNKVPTLAWYHTFGMLEEKSHQLKRGLCPHPLLPYIKKNRKVVFLVNLLIWSANGIAILKKCKILSSTLKTFSSFRMWLWGNLPLGPYPFSIGHPINPYMADYFHITGPLEDCNSSSQSGFFSVSRERGMQYVEFIKEKLTFFLMYQKTMANS